MDVYKLQGYSYITICRLLKDEIRKIDFDICKQPRETIDAYYKRQTVKPDIITNAGFFNMSNGATLFSTINERVVCSGDTTVRLGVGIKGEKDLKLADVKADTWRDFMSAYPALIVDGKAFVTNLAKEIDYKARRTVFGWNNTYVYVLCVDNPGVNFKTLKNICLNLGMTNAVNFDGGGSTRMLVNGVRKTTLSTNRAVDSVLCIYLNKTDKNVDYYGKINCSALNVRAGAGTSYSKLATITDKSKVYHIVAENYSSTWGKIEGLGWVSLGYIIRVNKPEETTKPPSNQNKPENSTVVMQGMVNARLGLNVRSGPGTKYSKIMSLPNKTVVNIYSITDGWGKIAKDQNRYVSMTYIDKV